MPNETIVPHQNDVLMGRGGRNNRHTGNEKLREFARRVCLDYQNATKKGKSAISQDLVEQMRELVPAGRFLKPSAASAEWIQLPDSAARDKTSQVIRDALRQVKSNTTDKRAIAREQHTPDRTLLTNASLRDDPTCNTPPSFMPPPSPLVGTKNRIKRRRIWDDSTFYSPPPKHSPPAMPQSHTHQQPHGEYTMAAGVAEQPSRHHPAVETAYVHTKNQSSYVTPQPSMSSNRERMESPVDNSLANINEYELFHGSLLEVEPEREPPYDHPES